MEDEKRDRSNIRQSVVDLRPELHPVNWFESFKSPQANLAIHAVRIVHVRKKHMSICQICCYTMVEIDYPFGAQERLLICAAAERRLQRDRRTSATLSVQKGLLLGSQNKFEPPTDTAQWSQIYNFFSPSRYHRNPYARSRRFPEHARFPPSPF